MERALRIEDLQSALGQHVALPSAEELQQILVNIETTLFIRKPNVPYSLLATAWYLHGIASSGNIAEAYPAERRRRAFALSGHIFELALDDNTTRLDSEMLGVAFAAMVGYRRGELEPNAMAIYRRVESRLINRTNNILSHVDRLPLELGVSLLGFDIGRALRDLRLWRNQFSALAGQLDVASLTTTVFGPPQSLVEAGFDILAYLLSGDDTRLTRARSSLQQIVTAELGAVELTTRWVASQLLAWGSDLGTSSIWAALPPDLPRGAKLAFSLRAPNVLTLWKPQQTLLSIPSVVGSRDTEARRLLITVPTSSGKTLVGQFLMVAHLATRNEGVCYVAPTRSLAREVRRSLQPRLAMLQRQIGRDLGDDAVDVEADAPRFADVEIFTPERLAKELRRDPAAVLSRFGLFVFDEAQMLAESGRGLAFELSLSFLHTATRDSGHRIILLSAALGNRAQVAAWLSSADGQPAEVFHSDWRGPRRLHAVFNTDIRWPTQRRLPQPRSNSPRVNEYDLYGIVRLKPIGTLHTQRLGTTQPIGQVRFHVDAADNILRDNNGRARRAEPSTPNYVAAARIVEGLGSAGTVLVVMSTRAMCRSMALALAKLVGTSTRARPIADFVKTRLGDDHPLTECLTKGVAYHHALLPSDVLSAIESAIRDDSIRYVVSTSTLTEGINLPVRTVVIAETQYAGQQGSNVISAVRMVNAVGRAGRATRETEGWVVLVKAAPESDRDFDELQPTDEDLRVDSRLGSPEMLAALEEFLAAIAASEEALFTHPLHAEMQDFISFVWFASYCQAELADSFGSLTPLDCLERTLAFRQLSPDTQALYSTALNSIRTVYNSTDRAARSRWVRYGSSIRDARSLDQLADSLTDVFRSRTPPPEFIDIDVFLDSLSHPMVLESVLRLGDARPWAFYQNRGTSHRTAVDVSIVDILRDWINGSSLQDISTTRLASIPDNSWRLEQLVEHITGHFEYQLAWASSILVLRVSEALGDRVLVDPQISNYIRYGTRFHSAIEMMQDGVRSRRLANTIAEIYGDMAYEDVVATLASMPLRQWRTKFEASPDEVLDLLNITRRRGDTALRELLEAGEAAFRDIAVSRAVALRVRTQQGIRVRIEEISSDRPPRRLALVAADGERIAVAHAALHTELQALLESGLEVECELQPTGSELQLVVRLLPL